MPFISSENKLVTCPYDEVHKVKASRLQLHIAKCKLNHLDLVKKVCPFNATHLLPVGEYDHHLITCPDRAPLDRQLAQSVNKNNPFKGRTDIPQTSDPVNDDEEDWDTDARTIVQLRPAPVGAVLEPREFAQPSERKNFYVQLHSMPPTEDNDRESMPVKTVVPIKPHKAAFAKAQSAAPRQPITDSEAKMIKTKPDAKVMENLGLGRGKPVSRIAANFPSPSAQKTSYSSIVGDFGNLGLGRGRSKPYNGPAPMFDDEDDFPALGCGRGVLHRK